MFKRGYVQEDPISSPFLQSLQEHVTTILKYECDHALPSGRLTQRQAHESSLTQSILAFLRELYLPIFTILSRIGGRRTETPKPH